MKTLFNPELRPPEKAAFRHTSSKNVPLPVQPSKSKNATPIRLTPPASSTLPKQDEEFIEQKPPPLSPPFPVVNNQSFVSIPSQAGPMIDLPSISTKIEGVSKDSTQERQNFESISPVPSSASATNNVLKDLKEDSKETKIRSKLTGRYPREFDVLRHIRMNPDSGVLDSGKAVNEVEETMHSNSNIPDRTRRKIRKKRKFRLIPTHKHFEGGRFIGR